MRFRSAFSWDAAEAIEWRSPIESDQYAEYYDEAFLERLGIEEREGPPQTDLADRGGRLVRAVDQRNGDFREVPGIALEGSPQRDHQVAPPHLAVRRLRHEQEGRAYRYHPVVAQEEAGGQALRRIVDKIFQGSAEMALARLVSDRPLSAHEVARLKALLDEAAEEDR